MSEIKIKEQELKIEDNIVITKVNVITGEVTRHTYHNIFTTVGRAALCRRLKNDTSVSNTGIISYSAVGTNASTPALADTQLGAEIYRKIVDPLLISIVSGSITFTIYYGTTEAIGSLKEFGLFGEAATGTANSGTLFNRVSINETKTGSDALTIDATITFA